MYLNASICMLDMYAGICQASCADSLQEEMTKEKIAAYSQDETPRKS